MLQLRPHINIIVIIAAAVICIYCRRALQSLSRRCSCRPARGPPSNIIIIYYIIYTRVYRPVKRSETIYVYYRLCEPNQLLLFLPDPNALEIRVIDLTVHNTAIIIL